MHSDHPYPPAKRPARITLIALIPIVLFLGLTFGATLAASIITSPRAAAGQKELLSRILDGRAKEIRP